MNDKRYGQIKIEISIFLCMICVGGSFLFFHNNNTDHGDMVTIGNLHVAVEIADTEESRHRGLGGRQELCDRCGMLFLFDEPKKRTFWMKDMLFDIDIIWIYNDHVVGIERAVPYSSKEKTVVTSPYSVNRVLEVPSGIVDRHAIYIGQKVGYVNKVFEK